MSIHSHHQVTRRLVVYAATAVLLFIASLAAASPATADPAPVGGPDLPEPAPVQAPSSQKSRATVDCDPKSLSVDGSVADNAVYACVRRLTGSEAKELLRTEGPVINAVVPRPAWCDDPAHIFNGWWITRFGACSTEAIELTVHNQSGGIVGAMTFLEISYAFASSDINRWAHQVELRRVTATGLAVGSSAQGSATCTGACSVAFSTFPSQSMDLGTDAEGEAQFVTTVALPGDVGVGNSRWTYFFTNPSWSGPSTSVVSPAPTVRCDNATPGSSSVGCVFFEYEPVHVVSLSGATPTFAAHVAAAQATGLPGAYPAGTPLTRLTNAALVTQNGNTACPAAWPRPAGHSCDEYPFRSTWQGAFTGGGTGRTHPWCQIPALGPGSGPVGWSSCMIPATENSSAGGSLGFFYSSNRVIEADPFYVWIVA